MTCEKEAVSHFKQNHRVVLQYTDINIVHRYTTVELLCEANYYANRIQRCIKM